MSIRLIWEGGKPAPVKILINAAGYAWHADSASYEEIAGIVGVKDPTISYSKGPGGRSGTLLPGQRVETAEGMAFDAVRTDSA